MEKNEPADPSLARQALEYIRALCKGNGVKAESVSVKEFKGEIVPFTAHTYIEIRPQISEKKIAGKNSVGTVVGTEAEVQQQIDKTIISAVNDPSSREKISRLLLGRPDHGFGLHGYSLNVDFLSRDFCWHENCKTCHGSGRAACARCHGQQRETCPECRGKTMVHCPLCRGSGNINGPNGRPQACSKCHGQRQVICMMCHRTGRIACRQCKGTGTSVCTACSGSGWYTHIVHLSTQAATYFEYDRVPVPAEVMPMLDQEPGVVLKNKDIEIKPEMLPAQSNALGVKYDVKMPFGEIVFALKNKPVKAMLFGYNAKLLEVPEFLDTLIASGMKELEAAAAGSGSVAGRLKKAGRFRVIALALLNAAQSSSKKTAGMLAKKYPAGLSIDTAKKIADLSDRATARITRKPRYYGLILGLVLVAGFYAAYYIGPGRGIITPHVGNPDLNIVIDLFIIFLGGTITTICIQLAAGNALREGIGHLVPAKDRKRLVPKTRSSGWWGYAGGLVIYFIMIEASLHYAPANTPAWYVAARQYALQFIAPFINP